MAPNKVIRTYKNGVAVVTGGASGIGREISRMWESLNPMPPEQFAKKALNALIRNKAVIVIPSWWKRFWWINRLAPSLGLTLAQKRFEANLREFSEEGNDVSGQDQR